MIWVIGNGGMLGQELCRSLNDSKLDHTGTDREVSILEKSALQSFAEKHKPEWIINCSAYTAVDKAEDESEAAFAINRDGVKNIAEVAASMSIPVIHISTDYVFDGTSNKPLTEDHATNPVGVYGSSKLAGEEILQKLHNKFFIIRTAWLYGQFGPNFVFTMMKLMNKLESIKVVEDQIGSPTWARELVDLITTIIKSKSKDYGIYHFSGEGQCSWYDFAREIYKVGRENGFINSGCSIAPCTSDEYPTKATRPPFSLLSKDKIKKTYNFPVRSWEESLSIFLKGINANDII